jgi:hypothetical protein
MPSDFTEQDVATSRFLIERIEDALRRAGGTHRLFPDVMKLLETGAAQMFQEEHGVVITEVMQHPRLRELNVWLAAGQLEDCVRLQPQIEAFARMNDCDRIIGRGRRGWERICASRMGMQPAGVFVEKWLRGPPPQEGAP